MQTKYKLFKLSEPGWELEFDTRKEVEYKLLSCICYECKEEVIDEIVIHEVDSVEALLSVPCGLEFDFEEITYD